jgi:type VI secretion system secreted protein VgrG
MDGSANVSRRYDKADLEVFDYPGEYEQGGEANDYAKIRIEELQAQYETLHGQTDARGICSGYRFQFQDFKERTDQNRKFLVQSANHTIELDYYEADVAPPSDSVYHCAFAALDADTPFKPARITPKPLIQGPQTAVVVGPGGEEIYTDNDGYGQVKVQFHWDRQGKKDDKSSCWIRVSQPWAGEKWGGVFLPRIGQEVIVEFLEGDPDRPIITGRVYNNDQKPPYDLPANKTQSGFKSRSSKGGGAANFNEIRFEDKKGSEELYIHAEKDKTIIQSPSAMTKPKKSATTNKLPSPMTEPRPSPAMKRSPSAKIARARWLRTKSSPLPSPALTPWASMR